MDTEVSLDQAPFVDCTNEAIEIAPASGVYYIDLTAVEMNADMVIIKCTWANLGAQPTIASFYPEEAGDIRVNVTQVAAGLMATAADVWNYLVTALGPITTVGGLFKSLLEGIKGKTDMIGTGNTTVDAPVMSAQKINVTQGDDYKAVDGRSFDFSYSGIPNLTGGSCKMNFGYPKSPYTQIVSITGTILNPTTVRFEPSSAQTALLPVGTVGFEVEITLPSGSIITPITLNVGVCTVIGQTV